MARYRVKLDAIHCLQSTSAGQYNDTLTVLFAIKPAHQGAPDADMVLNSPLGMRGKRLDIRFAPGTSHKLVRQDSAFGYGRNFDWELTVDIPEDSDANWIVEVLLVNDRDIDDPYAITKLLTGLGLAAGTGGAGALFGKGDISTFGSLLVGAAKGLGGEALKQLVGSLFKTWPKCSGRAVFRLELPWNRHNFGASVGTTTFESKQLDAVPNGCHQPKYLVDLTVEPLTTPSFGKSPSIRKSTYQAVQAPALTQWHGTWHDNIHGPLITVTIGPSAQGGPRDHEVRISEAVMHQGKRHIIIAKTYPQVAEHTRNDLFYSGKIVEATPTGIVQIEDGPGQLTQKTGSPLVQQAVSPLLWKGAGSIGERTGTVSDVLSSFQRPETLEAVWKGEAASTFQEPRSLDAVYLDEVVGTVVTEPGATLYIPEHEITLRLYNHTMYLDTGEVMTSGPLLRYYRKFGLSASLADVQLGQGRPIG